MGTTYKTTIAFNRRDALKAQLDDFATFQWRGHNMFDDYGVFIINEEKGSLKFYNGPGFSNQYAKTQFSTSSSMFLGIDFSQQTISMKVGVYWFSIEQYQELLECLSPYAINYLTFDFEPKYGYLVKLNKITDSTRHIVGYDKGQPRYYTELDLVWGVVGESCVRSNTAYEWIADHDSLNQKIVWTNNQQADTSETSLISTPLVFELPLIFNNSTSQLSFSAQYNDETPRELFNIELHNLIYQSSAVSNQITQGQYEIKPDLIPHDIFDNGDLKYDDFGIYSTSSTVVNGGSGFIYDAVNKDFETSLEGDLQVSVDSIKQTPNSVEFVIPKHLKEITINLEMGEYNKNFTINLQSSSVNDDTYSVSADFMSGTVNINYTASSEIPLQLTASISVQYWNTGADVGDIYFPSVYNEAEYNYLIYVNPILPSSEHSPKIMLFNSVSYNSCELTTSASIYIATSFVNAELSGQSFLQRQLFDLNWNETSNPPYQLLLRYDSETGLMYIQKGAEDTWYLLCYQTDNNNGDYLLKSTSSISRFKIPGVFDWPNVNIANWKFILEYKNLNITEIGDYMLNAAITSYARKNVI